MSLEFEWDPERRATRAERKNYEETKQGQAIGGEGHHASRIRLQQSVRASMQRGFPTRQREGYSVGPDRDLSSPPFHVVDFKPPVDSGNKIFLSRLIYSFTDPAPELLLWTGDWAVWPSSQHMPCSPGLGKPLGKRDHLSKHQDTLLFPDEADDAVSIIATSLLFIWDCHILTASGRDAAFVSHNEYGWFASQDSSVAKSIREKLAKANASLQAPLR